MEALGEAVFNRAGWSLFQKEFKNFCFGAKLASQAKVTFNNGGGGGGQPAGGGRSGKILSVYGNQRKSRNFEKNRTKWGQNMMHGDSTENGSAIKGNGSALSGRPMRAFKFKLTPALLSLRVSKPEGGRRVMTCLDPKEISWPKVLSGGPEIPKITAGLVEAQTVLQVSSFKKGILVKPSSFQVNSAAQSTRVIGESSKGILCGESESSESADASALNVDPVHGAPVVSPSVTVSAMVALKPLHAGESSSLDGFSPMVDFGAPRAETVMKSARCLFVVGECSRPAMESPVVLVSPKAPTGNILPFPIHDHATEPIVHTPVASHLVCEGDSVAPILAEES